MKLLMKIMAAALLSLSGTPAVAANGCSQWLSAATAPARGVAVVAHGLNLRPDRMDAMAIGLAQAGFDVLRVAFRGHCGINKDYLSVTADQWEADAREFHAEARERAAGRPLVLVAYSFSALVFQSLSADLPFTRRVYFAPALSQHWWYPWLVGVARILPWLEFRSVNLPDYAANPRSGARALVALEFFSGRWRGGAGREDPAPALVIADRGDELVSFSGLEGLVAERPLWRLLEVSNQGSTLPRAFHHLVIDEPSLGPAEWARVQGEVARFLLR